MLTLTEAWVAMDTEAQKKKKKKERFLRVLLVYKSTQH